MSGSCAVSCIELGVVDYEKALRMQKELLLSRRRNQINDSLLLLEHPHTYTLGRAPGSEKNLLVSPDYLAEQGIALYQSDRGGDITYHGPGQLVGYLIFHLGKYKCDVHHFIRLIEALLIKTLASFNITGQRDPINSGVWVGKNKIAAIGLGLRGKVTFHGFALNVNTDLTYFKNIVPCGIVDRDVTSISEELGKDSLSLGVVKERIISFMPEVFDVVMAEQPKKPEGDS